MSTLSVTTVTSPDANTPLILKAANTSGGQIVLNAANTDIQFIGNLKITSTVSGDGSGLTVPSANVANAAYGVANGAYTFGNTVYAAVNSAFAVINAAFTAQNTDYTSSNAAYVVANAAFGKANTALQNTTGTFSGALTTTSDLISGGVLQTLTTVQSSSGADLTLNASGSNRDIIFKILGTESMRYVGSTQNFGVGTATPNSQFEISKAVNNYWNGSTNTFTGRPQALTITNTQGGGYDPVLLFRQADQGALNIKDSGAIGMVGTASWSNTDTTQQTSDMYFLVKNNTNGISERMRITSAGNLGVGLTSPQYRLHVANGAIGITGLASVGITGFVLSQTDTGGSASFGMDNTTNLAQINCSGTGGRFRILTGGTTNLVLESNGNLMANSGFGSAATMYGCRAYMNYNGAGTAIRQSGGVSSVSRTGVGAYTVTLSFTMPDVNYSWKCTNSRSTIGAGFDCSTTVGIAPTTTAVGFISMSGTGAAVDALYYNMAIFR